MGNISWVEDSKLEVCDNEKMAPELISYMESIKGISTDLSYSPASDKNRNIPSRRMASLLNKIKPGELSGFKETFLFGYSDQDNLPTEHNSPPAIGDSDGMGFKNSGQKLSGEEVADISKVMGAYIRPERNRIDRGPKRTERTKCVSTDSKLKVMTYNIRGYIGKREELDLVMKQNRPTVIALQETNLNAKTNRLRLQKYVTVESKSHLQAGGRGLVLGIRKGSGLSISELIQTPHLLAAKKSGAHENDKRFSLTCVNLHMPHQTNRRKLVIIGLTRFLRKIWQKKKKSKTMLIGDFNKDTESSISMLNKIAIGLSRATVRNSKGSRMNGAVMGRMIDHITYSGFPNNPTYAKVIKSVDLSYHLPVVAEWDMEALKIPAPPRKIDVERIKKVGVSFVSINRADRRSNKVAEVKKARELMLTNKPRELWSWLNRYSGKFRSSLIDGPIFDKNRMLVTGHEEKSKAWAAHFEELAKDSTGNSRPAEK
ncbi:hypothetical protein AYI69_g11219 [Smittium culicis]|uniref:Endonuclease/exonuclease/phosphatase domain-containing protein n=1 Tax=Smittium culicis TaxID=133412 RepID=A0A1R1X0A2_9FUNG|nr:hypothetical protein AYI69_g11219 [Smittium culicis]